MTIERFPVEAGHILMFARAIGDENPAYDHLRAKDTELGTVIAPPTFMSASAQFNPDYTLRPKPGEPWMGSGREPTGRPLADNASGGTGLHAEQHFTYHRPVRAGDVVQACDPRPGREWEKEGRRGGKLVFSESIVEYRNEDGDLVVTARTVGVRTERTPGEQ